MGRWQGKETFKNAKLTEQDVLGIRARLNAWPAQSTVEIEADRFHVGLETIRRARRGSTYRDVGDARLGEEELAEIAQQMTPVEYRPTEDDAKASLRRLLAQQAAEANAKVESDRMMDELFSDAAIEARRRAAEAGVAARGLDPSLRDEPTQERIGNALED